MSRAIDIRFTESRQDLQHLFQKIAEMSKRLKIQKRPSRHAGTAFLFTAKSEALIIKIRP